MLPEQVSPPTEPLRNTTARGCLLCLYAQTSFLILRSSHHGIEGGGTYYRQSERTCGHHCVLCTAVGVVESAGFAYWCTRFIHLLKAISSISAGFEGLPVALVSFLWHLSFTGSMRNCFQIFFALLDHLYTCTHSKCCLLIVLLDSCLPWLCPYRSGSHKYGGWDNVVTPN